MRKKFCSILLLICFLVNMFAGVAFAGNDSKQISLRVEGIDGTILEETSYRTEAPSVYEAVYEILQDYNIPLEVAETSSVKYIFSINGEEAGTFGGYDGWLYMVNNEIPDEAMDARPIYDGDEIVLYYGEYPPGTYVPTVELSQETVEAGTGFTVTVTSTYYDWDQMTEVTVSLKDVEINLSGETYYTDDNGEAVITAPMVPGDYSLKISLDRDDSFPLIVRTTKNITVTEAAEAPRVAEGHVVVSVEKFTLGQGYLIEPMVFPFYEGDNGASLITNVLTEYLGENSYRHTGTIEKSFYLASVKDDSSDPLNIPKYILDAIGYEPDENDREEGWLGEFDYTSDSGWMYAVNGVFLGNGFSDYSPKDGDVVRVQFTLYGYGADLGAVSEWGQQPLINVADKDALTAKIAEINSDPDKYEVLADSLVRKAYDNAYQVLVNMESTQESVDEALLNLEKTLNGEDPEMDTVQLAREHLADSLAFLYESTPNPTFGTLGGEWSILALARGGYAVSEGYYDTYYNNVINEVKRLMPASGSKPEGKLDRNKGTEHSRLILGLTSIGKDITNVGGYDIRQALADYNYVIRQGINGPIFALIAFDSHNYDIPVVEGVSVQSTRDMWINYILDKEISKGTATAGGWALSGNTPDPDITAMAIQALTPYYGRSDVKGAVDRAISWLSNAQDADGGYSSWGSANIESIAQVVVALTGLGIDSHTDSRFIKNGHSAIEALLTYAIPGGGFKHVQSGSVDGMATDQGTYALVAYIRFLDGENSLYDMTDVELETKQPGEPGEPGKPEEPETPGQPAENEIKLPEGDKPEVRIPSDNKDYIIPITKQDSHKEIRVEIPANRQATVAVSLPLNEGLPRIEATKGDVSLVIPQGVKVTSGDTSALELLTSKNANDGSIKNKINQLLPWDKQLDQIVHVYMLGGSSRVVFSDFVTLKFAGMKGKEAAYIEGGTLRVIAKYASDTQGRNSGKEEYAYDDGNDLIVKTKHFTDFVVYAVSNAENGNGKNPKSNKYVTLSIDKLTIKKGYVLRPTQVEFEEGETVWDVTKRVMDSRGIAYTYVETPKYNSVYVEWIDGDGEFDHGDGSGWMYSVNGWYPNYGSSLYKLRDGDVVQWRYTTNLGADLGQDITKWERPTISVKGIKNNQKVSARELTFQVTAKDANGKSLIPAVKLNGKTVTGKNGEYTVKLAEGENIITITAIDGEGNRAGETYTVTYNPPKTANTQVPSSVNGPQTGNRTIETGSTVTTARSLEEMYADFNAISPWAREAVEKATKNGFVTGFDGKFNPQANVTRAEFTKMMVSVLGLNLNTVKAITFADVKETDWFYPYVNAAYQAGIIQGTGNEFKPNDRITREQMAAIIVRALQITPTKAAVTITDLDQVSAWARAEVETAVALGLMVGDQGRFNPKGLATREMAIVVAMRAFDYTSGNTAQDTAPVKESNVDVTRQIQETAGFLQKEVTDPVVASVGGEWTVFGLSRSGVDVPEEYYQKYYANAEKTLKEKSGILHKVKYTEYDRVILALTAIGKDVKNVAGYDLTKPLADFNTVIKQGINGPIFALIALDSNNYEIPKDNAVPVQTTRQMLIDYILGREIEGGGWALGEHPAEPDPDITAMAIQSLARYYNQDQKVKAAVDRGLAWLSKVQEADGGYTSWRTSNVESIAQVIIALTSLGIDPYNDPRFIKNGNSAVDALLSFSVPGGGFYHVKPGGVGNGGAQPGEVDLMATDQALLALIAYDRFINGQNSLYDLTDVNR